MELTSTILSEKYYFFQTNVGLYDPSSRTYTCDNLVNGTKNDSKSMSATYIKNTFNIPNYAAIFNFFGVGAFFGAGNDESISQF